MEPGKVPLVGCLGFWGGPLSPSRLAALGRRSAPVVKRDDLGSPAARGEGSPRSLPRRREREGRGRGERAEAEAREAAGRAAGRLTSAGARAAGQQQEKQRARRGAAARCARHPGACGRLGPRPRALRRVAVPLRTWLAALGAPQLNSPPRAPPTFKSREHVG